MSVERTINSNADAPPPPPPPTRAGAATDASSTHPTANPFPFASVTAQSIPSSGAGAVPPCTKAKRRDMLFWGIVMLYGTSFRLISTTI